MADLSRNEILVALATKAIDANEAGKLLDELEAKKSPLHCKVSQKGAMSVYGLQRMPVTLYFEQWVRLLGFEKELRAFLEEHSHELRRKGDPKADEDDNEDAAVVVVKGDVVKGANPSANLKKHLAASAK